MSALRNTIIGLTAVMLAGCMVGPNFQRPDAPRTDRYTETPLPQETASTTATGGAAQRFVAGGDLPAQWWSLYRSEPLDRLMTAHDRHEGQLRRIEANGFDVFGAGGSSYYYSRTSMAASGTLTIDGTAVAVTGSAWFDHQWGDFIAVGGGGWDIDSPPPTRHTCASSSRISCAPLTTA